MPINEEVFRRFKPLETTKVRTEYNGLPIAAFDWGKRDGCALYIEGRFHSGLDITALGDVLAEYKPHALFTEATFGSTFSRDFETPREQRFAVLRAVNRAGSVLYTFPSTMTPRMRTALGLAANKTNETDALSIARIAEAGRTKPHLVLETTLQKERIRRECQTLWDKERVCDAVLHGKAVKTLLPPFKEMNVRMREVLGSKGGKTYDGESLTSYMLAASMEPAAVNQDAFDRVRGANGWRNIYRCQVLRRIETLLKRVPEAEQTPARYLQAAADVQYTVRKLYQWFRPLREHYLQTQRTQALVA